MYDFLLVTNSNFGLLPFSRYWPWKLENRWIFPTHPALEFGDEIWRQKTTVLGLPDGEEVMARDGQTDTLRLLLPALA